MKKLLPLILIFSISLNIFCISTVFADDRNPKMAELVSTLHRKVPTEFKKSNDLNDILHFDRMTIEQQENAYLSIKEQGDIVCTEDKFFETISCGSDTYGNAELIDIENQAFSKAIRVNCTKVPEKSVNFMLRTDATPEKNPGDGVDSENIMLLALRMRTLSTDADDGMGKIQVQIEHPKTYKKALFKYATAGNEWTVIYLPFTGVKNATSIGIRCGFAIQTIELGGIEIINLGPDFDVSKLPSTINYVPNLDIGAEWRKEANKRIEKLRKGNFSVIVKDKHGNAIEDAQVEFDMFEHEFHFGNAISSRIYNDSTYAEKHQELFNAAVLEHNNKWAPYENNPQEARRQVEGAKKSGSKYIRGHSLFWERMKGSDGASYLTPKYMEAEEVLSDENVYLEYCRNHIREICTDYYDDFVEWDVINEVHSTRKFVDIHGADTWKSQFEWARDYTKPGTDLYYNDYEQLKENWTNTLEELIETGADFDGIGFQSHYDDTLPEIPSIIAKYEEMENYGDKKLKVTEYSCSIPDQALQANFTRDALISAFAEDDMTGFLYWGFYDGTSYASYSPFYDKEWNLKPAGEQFIDLVYNKWWTKDAKATTDNFGKATINGFYGDYDVSVTAKGKTQTVMAAFHKGYDNVLEIVLEDTDVSNDNFHFGDFSYTFDITQQNGKRNLEIDLNNHIGIKGLDYTVCICFYNQDGSLLGIKKDFFTTTGASTDATSLSDVVIPDKTDYAKIFIWALDLPMTPLAKAEIRDIN